MLVFAGLGVLAFVAVVYVGLTLGTGVSPEARPHAISGAAATVRVTEHGFEPALFAAPAGKPVALTFVRTTDQTCATEITVPALGIRKPLPLNQPVVVDMPMPGSGAVAFECGMKMLKGSVIAQ
jgi:plastocyanin domain-containing protein